MSQTEREPQSAVKSKYALRLKEGQSLADVSAEPSDTSDAAQAQAKEKAETLRQALSDWQERLYAERQRKLLVVLQAMDTGGKDGTIRNVFRSVNAMGIKAARFEAPSREDLSHDYLWRVHRQVPANGQIGIFNRSHYEDVLTVRVNEWVPEAVWRKRYAHIRAFERMLSDEGTCIVKLYLHIDRDEQRQRLQSRLDDPRKHWKFDENDLSARQRWDDYLNAYGDAIHETDADHAPWYVIPANRKWYRDLAVLKVLVQTLEQMDPKYPSVEFDPSKIVID